MRITKNYNKNKIKTCRYRPNTTSQINSQSNIRNLEKCQYLKIRTATILIDANRKKKDLTKYVPVDLTTM